ncbi:hypothetical protein ASwh1_345 [Aeromonas phage Aswh_1]|nr:hypothetical protein ASwh1_345 [Aeromonas phage Aswh_1]
MEKLVLPIGTVIPRGYVVGIESWENDGDNYGTIHHTGLTSDDVEFFKLIRPLFNSRHDWQEPGHGNSEFDDSLVIELVDILEKNFQYSSQFSRFLSIDIYSIDENEEVPNREKIKSCIIKNITGRAVDYDYYEFIRVVESIHIWWNSEEYQVQEIPARFVETVR